MANKITIATLFAIVAITILLTFPSNANADSKEPLEFANKKSVFQTIRDFFFPTIEITIANDGEESVYYLCKLTKNEKGLHELKKGDKFIYSFKQIAFPMRWCYLYINDRTNGFFWSYNVRLRCTKCFWSITNYPYLYRSDRTRWERQELFNPLDFNISNYQSN